MALMTDSEKLRNDSEKCSVSCTDKVHLLSELYRQRTFITDSEKCSVSCTDKVIHVFF